MADNRVLYAEMMQNILLNGVSFSVLKNEAEEKDKGFLNMLLMTAFRQLTFIKTEVLPQFIKRKIPQKQQILEFILYLGATELLFMKTPEYAVINSYVEAAKAKTDKFGANFVNAVLRNILRQKEKLQQQQASKYFSREFLKILKQDYTPQEITAMEHYAGIEPPLDLTVKNAEYVPQIGGIILPTGSIRTNANTKVTELPGFHEGEWWVQDAASALTVKSLGDIKSKKALDLCAAPGGKTAQLLCAGAFVTAVDISEKRLLTLQENMERLKLKDTLSIICADALNFDIAEKFDIILIDAPCSATGTFRRHPEIMHTKTVEDVKKQSLLQKKILDHAAGFLTPGGILLYATCSLAKAEGEKQIVSFLKTHQDFNILPIKDIPGTEKMQTKEGFLRILPQHFADFYGADGFFIARLQRKI